jgi:flagellar biosynthesis protein FlhB
MDLKEAFKIRKKDAETDEVIITIGNHLATKQVFKSEEEAQKVIDATDWNLVAALIYACKEADQWEEKQKEVSKKEEE